MARAVAQHITDVENPSEEAYGLILEAVAFLRSKEYSSLKHMARFKDKDDHTARSHRVAMQAFEFLRDAHEEVKSGLETGEWDPERVVELLHAAVNATGEEPPKTKKKRVTGKR
ncbi:hypothetical protein SEA_GAECEO_58 [Microbacterium phage GaeCeo]|nr:hypothetical protein SEA_GAECEO_58 [Microbacterium phage GaeCeo]